MLNLPVLRWGQPYTSMDVDEVVHFADRRADCPREPRQRRADPARHAQGAARARRAARDPDRRPHRPGSAPPASSTRTPTLPMGDGTQTPDEFVRAQSASTGLPERMCRANMKKNAFVLAEMRSISDVADARARLRRAVARLRRRARRADQLSGAEPGRRASCCRRTRRACTRSGCRSSRCRSAWCSSRGRRSRGRRIGWRKRSSRPAFRARRSRSIPAWATSARRCSTAAARNLIFGGTATVDRYRGNPGGAGARPGLLEDPDRRRPGRPVGTVPRRDGRQRVRQQRARLHQLLGDLGQPPHARDRRRARAAAGGACGRCRPRIPRRAWRRSPCPGVADAISQAIDADLQAPGVTDVTARHRDGPRVLKQGRADYLLPTVVHCESPDAAAAKKEYMFPFVTVVRVPGRSDAGGDRPDAGVQRDHLQAGASGGAFMDAMHIDRLNLGPVPTIQLNWLQPHEGQPHRLPVPRARVSVGAN